MNIAKIFIYVVNKFVIEKPLYGIIILVSLLVLWGFFQLFWAKSESDARMGMQTGIFNFILLLGFYIFFVYMGLTNYEPLQTFTNNAITTGQNYLPLIMP